MAATEREPDEKLWQLDIIACDDGDILLSQGACWSCGEDVPVRLHRAHLPLLAETAGWITHNELHQATDALRDRLHLLAAMVRAYHAEGHPLRAAADELTGKPSRPTPPTDGDQAPTVPEAGQQASLL